MAGLAAPGARVATAGPGEDDQERGVAMTQYWFNTKTRQVDEGHQSDWTHLLGPYPTRAAAEKALETARAKTERWDTEERRWRDGEDT